MAKHALAVLVGRAPGNWSPPEFDLTAMTLPGRLPVSLPSELLHQRPDIQAAEAQLHAASAEIGIADGATLSTDHPLGGGLRLFTGRGDLSLRRAADFTSMVNVGLIGDGKPLSRRAPML